MMHNECVVVSCGSGCTCGQRCTNLRCNRSIKCVNALIASGNSDWSLSLIVRCTIWSAATIGMGLCPSVWAIRPGQPQPVLGDPFKKSYSKQLRRSANLFTQLHE